MNAIRKAALLKLAGSAYEMNLDVARGVLSRDESGDWMTGERNLSKWLEDHAGEDLVVLLGSLDDDREVPVRTCRTCGRDYTELECPHCRSTRIRLRGEP